MTFRADPHLDPLVAANYDRNHAERFDTSELEPTIDLLAELADGGPVLEFAIGTGRVALPLAGRGLSVAGIDLSEPMVDQLRAKPGGRDLQVAIGDMATTVVEPVGGFALALLVFNTLGNLRTYDAQTSVFANAARHLRSGGRFVVEIGVSKLPLLPPGETTRVFAEAQNYLGFDRITNREAQQAESNHWRVEGGHLTRTVCPYRWVEPDELDGMAANAGLSLEGRWADWDRQPFGPTSTRHVSVWRKG